MFRSRIAYKYVNLHQYVNLYKIQRVKIIIVIVIVTLGLHLISEKNYLRRFVYIIYFPSGG